MNIKIPLLVVIAGPTAVGKTDLCINLAKKYKTEILSCDSRQFYKEMSIGTAKPNQAQLSQVKHHLINNLSVKDDYNISKYEEDSIELLEKLFKIHKIVFMTGGSGLYIDAVCDGIDFFPVPTPKLRKSLHNLYKNEGIKPLQDKLKILDEEYSTLIDMQNPMRLIRALEVCITTGEKYSDLRINKPKQRNFNILKICINTEKNILHKSIEQRVDIMIENGLLNEVKKLKQYRGLNALKTMGYKEMFEYLDGNISLEQAITDIKTNTRRYAKRQLTWFKKDLAYNWFKKEDVDLIIKLISENMLSVQESTHPDNSEIEHLLS